jgi:hypothetical protein
LQEGFASSAEPTKGTDWYRMVQFTGLKKEAVQISSALCKGGCNKCLCWKPFFSPCPVQKFKSLPGKCFVEGAKKGSCSQFSLFEIA